MMQEAMGTAGHYIDVVLKWGWIHWYISVPVMVVLWWFLMRFFPYMFGTHKEAN